MAFFKVGEKRVLDNGRVYVLEVTLDTGVVLHKVGLCYSDRATDRMMEIARDFFTKYRYVPNIRLRRDKKYAVCTALVEKHFHNVLDDLSYKFDKKFSGSTEFFEGLDEDMFLKYFDGFSNGDVLGVHGLVRKSSDYKKLQGLTPDNVSLALPEWIDGYETDTDRSNATGA